MDEVEQIKTRVDISDFIGEYIALKKAGKNFKALCPFHGEKSASFIISPERQIWHCFGCQKGGDIFTFFMEYENVEFSEALKLLAKRAQVALGKTPFASEREQIKARIYTLNHMAAHFYNYMLLTHPIGKKALQYLIETRKTPAPLIQKFVLGYAPTQPALLSAFLIKKKGYKNQDLIEAGLAIERDGRMVDFFRGRIMFPLHDARGNISAFSGRVLTSEALPKYINTRETLVYKKGDTLYGIYFAKDDIKRDNKAIIVEGEFDVISSFREGISNIVAVKGTALTESQIKLLKRYTQKIAFCFDSDVAGTQAQRRSIELISKEGITASVILPPQGKDPDELLSENPPLFKQALKEEINIYEFIINTSLTGQDIRTAEGKRDALEKALPYLAAVENEVVKEHYFKKLAEALDTSLESVLKQADKIKHITPRPAYTEPAKKRDREELVEEYLFSLLLQSQNPLEYGKRAQEILSHVSLSLPNFKKLFQYFQEYAARTQVFSLNTFIQTLPTELIELVDTCSLTPLPPFKNELEYQEEFEKTVRDARVLSIKKQLRTLASQIKEAEKTASTEGIEKLHAEFYALTKLL